MQLSFDPQGVATGSGPIFLGKVLFLPPGWTLFEQLSEGFHLWRRGPVSMVVAPDILGDVERQSLSPDATLRREPTLDIAPEPFQSVDVCSVATAKLAQIMLHQAMHRALGRDAGIEVQGIGPDDRAAAHVRANQGIPRVDGQIGHDLRPHLPASAEDAEDRRVPCAAPAGAPALSTRGSPIAPATAWALMPRTNHPRTCPSNPGRTSAAAAAPAASRAGTGCNGVDRRAGSSISCVHTVGISAAEPPGHRMKEVAGVQLYPYSLKVLER